MKEYVEQIAVTRSKDIDGYVCRSVTWGITCESEKEAHALNFVKGATLAVIGMGKELPGELVVKFVVDRSALVGPKLCDGMCGKPISYVCFCRRCAREPDDRYHICGAPECRDKVAAIHYRVREREACWEAGT